MTINNNNIFGAFTLGEVRSGRLTGDWLNKETVANYGWFGGGTDSGSGVASSYVDRIDFSNDAATALSRGLITANKASVSATGNSNYGWFGGGINPTTTLSGVDRIDFSNDSSIASVRGPLSSVRYSISATGNSNYGWFGGGKPGSPTRSSTVDRIDFSNDSPISLIRGALSLEKEEMAASGNSNYGWFGGGYVAGGAALTKSSLDRIDFSNDLIIASIRGSMSSARYRHVSAGNSNYGWFGGGRNQTVSLLTSIDRMDFSNDLATGMLRGSFISHRGGAGATGNSNYGWFGGGQTTLASVERINFSNDSTTTTVGSLSIGRQFLGATSGVLNIRRQKAGNFGWFGAGGFPAVATVDRINFSNDSVLASPRGSLSAVRYRHAATGNSNYGWFGGGIPGSILILDRTDFSNDSATASVRGSLSAGRYYLSATGNSNYGWFGGGRGGSPNETRSTVDRINFSNDSATASVRGPLTSTRYRHAATGNSNYGWFFNTSSLARALDRIDFSNDSAVASVRGSLTQERPVGAAIGNSNYGWFGGGGGFPKFSSIDRIDFSNDLATASLRGSLSAGRGYLAATGNSNYGWFGGGASPGGSESSPINIVNRIDFSNDSAVVSVRGSLSAPRVNLAAVSNTHIG
jgi:hypothetical protein